MNKNMTNGEIQVPPADIQTESFECKTFSAKVIASIYHLYFKENTFLL